MKAGSPPRGRVTRSLVPIVALAIACVGAPPAEVENVSFAGHGDLTARGRAVIAAAIDNGWTPELIDANVVDATLRVRSHYVKVRIPFDEDRFSIRYVESEGLAESRGKIHRKYNTWVRNLRIKIQQESARDQL